MEWYRGNEDEDTEQFYGTGIETYKIRIFIEISNCFKEKETENKILF
jgi:hypothetical protein